MSRAAYLNQSVAGKTRPAGQVADGKLLFAWLKSLPERGFPHAAALLRDGLAADLPALEKELVEAFLIHAPLPPRRPHVEALLLAVLGRDPDARTIGFADHLPLPADADAAPPLTILERAVKVGEHTWEAWPEARRRREYLLLEFYDAVLTAADAGGRDEWLAACLRSLAREANDGG